MNLNLLNVNLKRNSNIVSSISKIYGVGHSIARLILNDLGISNYSRIKDLNQNVIIKILKWIDFNKVLIGDSIKYFYKRNKLVIHSNTQTKLNKKNAFKTNIFQ